MIRRAAAPHQRLSFSNFGSRIDCFACGENIDTSGDGWTGTDIHGYTPSFGGTSGASPIVTGAALVLQSWNVGHGKSRYSPAELRDLLSDPDLNTESANPGADRIGVMPDLRAIIESENPVLFIDFSRWKAVVWILFGVIQDGGGVVIKPGRGPVPIDPWGPLVEHLAPEKRDVLLGLAVTELLNPLELGTAALEQARREPSPGCCSCAAPILVSLMSSLCPSRPLGFRVSPAEKAPRYSLVIVNNRDVSRTRLFPSMALSIYLC